MVAHPFPEIADEVIQIIDWESLGIPPRHGINTPFKALSKRLWLNSSSDIINLSGVVNYLCIYGFMERARRVALSLALIPNGYPDISYMYINSCIVAPCCFLERVGYVDSAAPLREVALRSPGEVYRLAPAALDGSMLFNYFNDPTYDPQYEVGSVFGDIHILTNLWVYGSTSPKYNRQRIDELLTINLNHLFSLTKFKPWEHLKEPVG